VDSSRVELWREGARPGGRQTWRCRNGRETSGGPWKGEWWIYGIEICKLLMITTGGWAGSKFLRNFLNKALNLGRRHRRPPQHNTSEQKRTSCKFKLDVFECQFHLILAASASRAARARRSRQAVRLQGVYTSFCVPVLK
jgi:hypothetical protein